jgi:hypothetical protein
MEKYKPSFEEINKAEDMMTEEQKEMSKKREGEMNETDLEKLQLFAKDFVERKGNEQYENIPDDIKQLINDYLNCQGCGQRRAVDNKDFPGYYNDGNQDFKFTELPNGLFLVSEAGIHQNSFSFYGQILTKEEVDVRVKEMEKDNAEAEKKWREEMTKEIEENYHEKTNVNGIDINVEWNPYYRNKRFVLQLPQVEFKRIGNDVVYEDKIMLSDNPENAKKFLIMLLNKPLSQRMFMSFIIE